MVLGWGSKKAQVHHDDEDMSMEEILASIRKYVSEETAVKDSDQFQDTAKVMSSPYRSEADVRVQRRIVEETESVFAPSNTFEESALFKDATLPPKAEEFAVTKETLKSKPVMEELLTQDDLPTATINPFAKLAEASKPKEPLKTSGQELKAGAVTLDQLIGDLARPMIQQWLDQHMTVIVEKMVAQEIAKMTGQK